MLCWLATPWFLNENKAKQWVLRYSACRVLPDVPTEGAFKILFSASSGYHPSLEGKKG